VGFPHSQFDRPVAFPEDGIRGQGKAVGTKTPPTALLFLVRLLSEAKCPHAASRRLGLSRTLERPCDRAGEKRGGGFRLSTVNAKRTASSAMLQKSSDYAQPPKQEECA
jgi:hypothetical protein